MGVADRTPPTAEEYLAYKERFSNWGRWGEDDRFGTLNHITDERRAAAAGLVREGHTVSLAHPLQKEPSRRNPVPAQHYMMFNYRGSRDYIGVAFHGRVNTHIDAFCHIFTSDGRMYNGHPASAVTSSGAQHGSIDDWRGGIITRGVLYDIPRLKGVDYLDAESPVQAWDLADAAEAQGVEPQAGDAVLVRCGREPYFEAHPNVYLDGAPASYYEDGELVGTPGVHPSALEFLHEHDAALLGWDFLDAGGLGYPPPFEGDPRSVPVHEIAIPYMGLPLLDNVALEELAAACAERGRWEFMLVIAPLVVEGGTGSPVNPLAVF